jgi:hypothetical protein
MIKSFDATLTGKILWILAGAALALLLGISMFAPMPERFSGLDPVGSAWAGGPVCDADDDGYVIDHRKCDGPIDCDDTDASATTDCSGGTGTGSGTIFQVTFTGGVSGGGYSNPTDDSGNVANLVFNKLASEVEFTIGVGSACDGTYGGNPDSLEATMQVYDGLNTNADMVARLYFGKDNYKYKLELFEVPGSTYGWDGGDFPPFGKELPVTRNAGSWLIGRNGGPAGPCVGDSGTFSAPVAFTLSVSQ